MMLLFGMLASTFPMQMPSKTSTYWHNASTQGMLTASELDEVSGITSSQLGPYLWAHNDSGDAARMFLLDHAGNLIHTANLEGLKAYDNEDLTRGPCAPDDLASYCLFLADMGDNRHKRELIVVHKLQEFMDHNNNLPSLKPISKMLLRYPTHKGQDAEAIMSHPITGDLYILDKSRSGESNLYKVPREAHNKQTKKKLHDLELIAPVRINHSSSSGQLVTSGEFSAHGQCLILRTYLEVLTYCKQPEHSWTHALAQPPDRFITPAMLQSEAIAVDPNTHDLWITSERLYSPIIKLAPTPHMQAQGIKK